MSTKQLAFIHTILRCTMAQHVGSREDCRGPPNYSAENVVLELAPPKLIKKDLDHLFSITASLQAASSSESTENQT